MSKGAEEPNLVQPTYLSYDRGTILIRGDAKVPYSTWDDRVRAFRSQALYYREIVEFLKKSDRFAKTIVFCIDQEHASEMLR